MIVHMYYIKLHIVLTSHYCYYTLLLHHRYYLCIFLYPIVLKIKSIYKEFDTIS